MSDSDSLTPEEYKDTVRQAMKRAYAAGYAQRRKENDNHISVPDLLETEHINECFFYHMDGISLPYEYEIEDILNDGE